MIYFYNLDFSSKSIHILGSKKYNLMENSFFSDVFKLRLSRGNSFFCKPTRSSISESIRTYGLQKKKGAVSIYRTQLSNRFELKAPKKDEAQNYFS